MKNNLGWQVYDDEQHQQAATTAAVYVATHGAAAAAAAAAAALCIHTGTSYSAAAPRILAVGDRCTVSRVE